MILDLRIDNFAIIDHIDLSFSRGLIIFTGETGAGKSIIIDAVETLLGGHTDTTMVRTGADLANIGFFSVPEQAPNGEYHSKREELLEDPQLTWAGKSIAMDQRYGSTGCVSSALMKEIGQYLVDVTGNLNISPLAVSNT
jgi:DNA repair protein RecN (Recombination protein N)